MKENWKNQMEVSKIHSRYTPRLPFNWTQLDVT